MTEMIAAEPHLARRLLTRLAQPASDAARLAAAVRDAVDAGRPIIVTGCGTSEHAALGVVEILRQAVAAGRDVVLSEQAFELALDPPADALVIGVSHEGGSAATNAGLEAAAARGSTTALITAAAGSPGAALASIVVATGEMDQSWCHTVGYVSPLLVAAAVAGHLTGTPPDPERAAHLMADTSAGAEHDAEAVAASLANADRLLVVGSGVDRVAGRELVLKIEEASWMPAAYRDLETLLHGHLPAINERTGLILIATDPQRDAERGVRGRQALAAVAVLGLRAAAIVSMDAAAVLPAELTPAGRLVVPRAPGLPSAVGSLLGSAVALQVLTERIARARGTNPDPIRRDDPRYGRASAVAES